MQQRDDRELREKLMSLRDQHRALDHEIVALEADTNADQLLVKRLKKQKLLLKDQITSVEDMLTPDIIA
ncbi:MAG: YdcH family protein [Hyphomicrobiaceae bacterium]